MSSARRGVELSTVGEPVAHHSPESLLAHRLLRRTGMRALSVVLLTLLVGLVCRPALAADVPAPYDADSTPPPAAPPTVAPAEPATTTPVVPLPAPQAYDGEAPRRTRQPPPEVQPLVATTSPSEPSEGGLIAAESLIGFLTMTTALVVGVQATPWLLLAGPLATGALVCGIGSTSSSYTGSCAAAIGGAYLGSLLTIPLAYLMSGGGGSNDGDLGGIVAGALLGYLVGSTVGAVVGWNSSRTPKDHSVADVARLDAVASARGAPWREPLLPRGAALEGGAPRVTTPVLAFRF